MIDQNRAKQVIGGPLGVALGLIILLVLSGLTIASAISGDLSAAATTGASFITLAILMGVTKMK